MKLIRLRAGEWLAAAAAVAVPLTLALPWYEADSGDVSGYAAFAVIDILLLIAAAVGLTLAILQATQDSPSLPVAFGVLTVTAGFIATLLVLFRLIDEPGLVPVDVREGAWLGLLATVALTAGGWLSIANEHVRGLPPAPEPELRPSPRIAHRAQP